MYSEKRNHRWTQINTDSLPKLICVHLCLSVVPACVLENVANLKLEILKKETTDGHR
jgi:hypothetical protein